MARILVIDDDKDILRLLDFALQRVGHEVVTRSDGLQGLAEVEAQKPDLIVADVMMPKMTGAGQTRRSGYSHHYFLGPISTNR